MLRACGTLGFSPTQQLQKKEDCGPAWNRIAAKTGVCPGRLPSGVSGAHDYEHKNFGQLLHLFLKLPDLLGIGTSRHPLLDDDQEHYQKHGYACILVNSPGG